LKSLAYEKNAEFEDDYWFFVGRWAAISAVLTRTSLANSSVADVGCGTGGTTVRLARFGHVVGYDTSPEALEYCRRRGLTDVHRYQMPALPSSARGFGLITAFDVIEHVEDDVSFLRMLSDRLVPGGVICATVPAYQALWGHEDEISEHKRRYTRTTLNQAFAAAGLRIERSTYFVFTLLPPVALVKWFKRRFKSEAQESDLIPVPRPFNWALSQLLALEAAWLRYGNFPCGASVLIAGRKP
jgi:2-polyprenyl-3-methyl-5-hydroxy-6-metoxy-1,4-benzoquinol methylase